MPPRGASRGGDVMSRFIKTVLAGASVLVGIVAFPVRAHAAPVSHVTMFSETGDWVGAGRHRFYVSGSDSVTVSGDTRSLTVRVSGGSLGDSFSLDFAAPPDESLRPGLYLNAERAVFRDAGRPGIDIAGDGRGCNTITGRFDVKDIQTTANGTITRLWLTYEQHCEGGLPALFGEV